MNQRVIGGFRDSTLYQAVYLTAALIPILSCGGPS